jgi:hypothetical protein
MLSRNRSGMRLTRLRTSLVVLLVNSIAAGVQARQLRPFCLCRTFAVRSSFIIPSQDFVTMGDFVGRERGLWRCTLRVQSRAEPGEGGSAIV